MGFSSESVAAFIAVLGILSIIAQVSSAAYFIHLVTSMILWFQKWDSAFGSCSSKSLTINTVPVPWMTKQLASQGLIHEYSKYIVLGKLHPV